MPESSIQNPAGTDVFDGRSCFASNVAYMSPEFGKVSHPRIAEDGHYSVARAQSQRCLKSSNTCSSQLR